MSESVELEVILQGIISKIDCPDVAEVTSNKAASRNGLRR